MPLESVFPTPSRGAMGQLGLGPMVLTGHPWLRSMAHGSHGTQEGSYCKVYKVALAAIVSGSQG